MQRTIHTRTCERHPLGVTGEDRSELCSEVEIRDDRHRVIATVKQVDGKLAIEAEPWANLVVVRR